ncbi:MAG: helix-turn-helix domain-containing protein [bacterium]|nr:helix-turn-helix domain-containing protein [bacterium]
MTTGSHLLTLRAAAARLTVGTRTLQRFVARKEIGVVRVGRAVRFFERDIELYLLRNYARRVA